MFLLGVFCLGSSALLFFYESWAFGAVIPPRTFIALISGLFILGVDCWKKGLKEYAYFNWGQCAIYSLGGLL